MQKQSCSLDFQKCSDFQFLTEKNRELVARKIEHPKRFWSCILKNIESVWYIVKAARATKDAFCTVWWSKLFQKLLLKIFGTLMDFEAIDNVVLWAFSTSVYGMKRTRSPLKLTDAPGALTIFDFAKSSHEDVH